MHAGSQESRQLAGLLARELARQAREVFAAHAGSLMPVAFLAKEDTDKEVSSLWGDVWTEGSTSQSAAIRLYLADLVPLALAGGTVVLDENLAT